MIVFLLYRSLSAGDQSPPGFWLLLDKSYTHSDTVMLKKASGWNMSDFVCRASINDHNYLLVSADDFLLLLKPGPDVCVCVLGYKWVHLCVSFVFLLLVLHKVATLLQPFQVPTAVSSHIPAHFTLYLHKPLYFLTLYLSCKLGAGHNTELALPVRLLITVDQDSEEILCSESLTDDFREVGRFGRWSRGGVVRIWGSNFHWDWPSASFKGARGQQPQDQAAVATKNKQQEAPQCVWSQDEQEDTLYMHPEWEKHMQHTHTVSLMTVFNLAGMNRLFVPWGWWKQQQQSENLV